MILNELLNLNY